VRDVSKDAGGWRNADVETNDEKERWSRRFVQMNDVPDEVCLGKASCQGVGRLLLYRAVLSLFAGQSVSADFFCCMLFNFMLLDRSSPINDLDLQRERRKAGCFRTSLLGHCRGDLLPGQEMPREWAFHCPQSRW
jgi:hypothetical protein